MCTVALSSLCVACLWSSIRESLWSRRLCSRVSAPDRAPWLVSLHRWGTVTKTEEGRLENTQPTDTLITAHKHDAHVWRRLSVHESTSVNGPLETVAGFHSFWSEPLKCLKIYWVFCQLLDLKTRRCQIKCIWTLQEDGCIGLFVSKYFSAKHKIRRAASVLFNQPISLYSPS